MFHIFEDLKAHKISCLHNKGYGQVANGQASPVLN